MPRELKEFRIAVSEDRQTMRFDVPSDFTLTAQELQNVMRELARVRASMLPALPDEDPFPTTLMSVVPAARWYVQQGVMPTQVRRSLMHLGFGWIWMALSADTTKRLAEMLLHYLRNRPKLQ